MPNLDRVLLLILVTILVTVTVPIKAGVAIPLDNNSMSCPAPQAKAALLMDASSGRVLFEKNGQERLPPASVTKIMTALLVVETGDLDQSIIISEHAAQTPECTIYLQSGENLMRRTLLYACMLNSANDAATALAESVAGSEEAFVELMNRRAMQMGMVNTHFCNPHGLEDPQHYTTAYDLALATREALTYPEFRQVVSTRYKVIPWAHHQDRYLVNQNRLLYRYSGAIGVKTGYTRQAGNCVVSAAERNGMTLIAIALNSPTVYEDLGQMLDYGFNHYQMNSVEVDELLQSLPVLKGTAETVMAGPVANMQVALTAAEKPDLQVEVIPFADLSAPIEAGDIVGVIQLRLHDNLIAQSDLLAMDSIAALPSRFQSLRTAWRQFIIVLARWHLYNLLVLLALGYYAYSKKGVRIPPRVYRRPALLLRSLLIKLNLFE